MKDMNIQTLGYFLFRTFSHMVRLLNYELKASGLDLQYPQFAIMMVLSKKEGISQSELKNIVERDKASISRNVNYLEEKGYLKREAYDGKKKLLYLTDKGKDTIPMLYQIARKNQNTTLKGFSDEEKNTVLENLRKMYINISQITDRI